MQEPRNITILNMSKETRNAVAALVGKSGSPFESIEDCIASLMSYRMLLRASGDEEKAALLEETYHLKDIKVIYNYPGSQKVNADSGEKVSESSLD